MDHDQMRMKCLELATAQGLKGETAIEAARAMMEFAREGTLLEKAYGRAGDNRANRIETPMATVHKRPPFLDDYKPE